MKRFSLINPLFAAILALSAPTVLSPVLTTGVFAHVGHGDEFQAKGGVQRVQVKAETDQLLGIEVKPIASTPSGGTSVLIPVTALVDADGKQLVFVQYENFYEPVPVTTGATKGDLIEITKGLSVGEKLVTQGSLTLYAESRKTKNTASPSVSATAVPKPNETHAQADAKGLPHSHDTAGNMVKQTSEAAPQSNLFSMGTLATLGGAGVVLMGVIALIGNNRRKKSTFSNKKGGF